MQRRHSHATALVLAASWLTAPRVWRMRRAARRGNAAVEFALLFPIMVTLVFGLVDASNALIAYRRVTVAAEEAALIATELSVQSDGSTSLTPTQVNQASTAIFGVMPLLESQGSAQVFSVTMSAVVFNGVAGTGLPSGCSGSACTSYTQYNASVAWSVPLSAFAGTGQYLGTQQYRGPSGPSTKCGTAYLTQVSQATTPTWTTIPTSGMTPLSSVLVVDVTYTFTPLFTKVFVGAQTFMHTSMLPPRLTPPSYAPQYIAFDITATGSGTSTTYAKGTDTYATYICTGYL
jgi:Flp pilus assembly protein TadG